MDILEVEGIALLLRRLQERGYDTIGPTVNDNVIQYGRVRSVKDFPAGLTDEQGPGLYKLRKRDDNALFGFNVGPSSIKRFLMPPETPLLRICRGPQGLSFSPVETPMHPFAFIGVRGCDIASIARQREVWSSGAHAHSRYEAALRQSFIVAIRCTRAGATCFCASMGTGPDVTSGFDLALTEVLDSDAHYFVVTCGTSAGKDVLAGLPHTSATEREVDLANHGVEQASREMGRRVDTRGLKEIMYRNLASKQWQRVAERCLSCANCTNVCPTCFCNTTVDTSVVDGSEALRTTRWDSCFTPDFSYVHGGNVRDSIASRYRQWLTHKFATWIDQFGSSGCVGCGRCITWCPVGIDVTEELAALRQEEDRHGADG